MLEGTPSPCELERDQFADSAAMAVQSVPTVQGSGKRGGFRLSQLQQAFAREFVLNGGNSGKAALLAGYSESKQSAARALVNPAVLAEIKRLSIVHVEALLPIALRQLFDVMCDPECDPKARVLAANSILDRGGMKPKAAPLVQINQQNNVLGASAQELIAAVWEARKARSDSALSDIPAPMSDSEDADFDEISTGCETDADALDGPGDPPRGGESRGSHPSPANLPPSSHEYPDQSRMGWLWGRGVLSAGEAR